MPLPYYFANRAVSAGAELRVHDKYTGQEAGRVHLADRGAIELAISAAVDASLPLRHMPAYRRRDVLLHVVHRLNERAEEIATLICTESGKPIRDARGEVARAIDTFRIAAEESTRIIGEYLPLDISPRAEGYEGFVKRVPVGPCSFITPFNFPLNLVAHKVAPAIAVGCSFVLKPAPQTPMTALALGEMLAETDLPPGSFSIMPCEVADAAPLVEDERLKLLSFTGSSAVGWTLKSRAGKKKVLLELGGDAACIVDRDVDLDLVVPRLIFGAFYQSGQSCISVQRVIAHQSIYEDLKRQLIPAAMELKAGDPREESTFLGPLISEKDAQRLEEWVREAAQRGAHVLCGGMRFERVFFQPTIVENVPHDAQLACEEAFGPVLVLEAFDRFEDACAAVNRSRYGLQAGVFTRDITHAHYAWNHIEAGGVIVNDVPSMRVDSMPYGGVKDSGLGREGVRYAMQEMTEPRLMVLRNGGW